MTTKALTLLAVFDSKPIDRGLTLDDETVSVAFVNVNNACRQFFPNWGEGASPTMIESEVLVYGFSEPLTYDEIVELAGESGLRLADQYELVSLREEQGLASRVEFKVVLALAELRQLSASLSTKYAVCMHPRPGAGIDLGLRAVKDVAGSSETKIDTGYCVALVPMR